MPPVEFEPTIPASARLQTYTLNRAATGIGGIQSRTCKQVLVSVNISNLSRISYVSNIEIKFKYKKHIRCFRFSAINFSSKLCILFHKIRNEYAVLQ
jgi:hypothetical protein